MTDFYLCIEGDSDVGLARALIREVGGQVAATLGRRGKNDILKKLPEYNRSAEILAWLVILDLDDDFKCVIDARDAWLPEPASRMCFRIARHEMESWLLADPETIAAFLGVSRSLIPDDPDSIPEPKEKIVSLARRSRLRSVREGLVPRPGSGATIGPTYASDISAFAETAWRPTVAAENSESLARCLAQLRTI